jgi:hypothetical protein
VDELFEAVVVIFDSHLINRQKVLNSLELLKGNIYHFRDRPDSEPSVMLVFSSQVGVLEMDRAF